MGLSAELFASGLATGAIYALVALALALIFRATGHINFAQGEMATASTFAGWWMMQHGAPYWLAFGATLIASCAAGAAIGRLVAQPLAQASPLAHIATFVGLYAVINGLDGFLFGYEPRAFASPFGAGPFAGTALSRHQLGMIGAAAALMVGLQLFFRFTRAGLLLRASAMEPQAARLSGVRVARVQALGWGLAAAIGAGAGMLIAPATLLDPNMMLAPLLYGFAGAALGGLAQPFGAAFGGFAVGLLDALAQGLLPDGGALKAPLALAFILAALFFRPAGLFGRPDAARA
ncbi:MAG: branched-chain amino acid ABC transporter permease [Hyphomicrobiales bacterium]|nr:branched-chain amino acid ABC transporter permease [Hyphomicrobiales bacterium]